MKATKKYLLMAAAAVCSLAAKAQYSQTAYFMDGYYLGHEMNPAKDYDRKGYFTILPVITGMNFGVHGNLGLNNFVKPLPDGNGKLGTFLHPVFNAPQSEHYWEPFHKNNNLQFESKFNILNIGFRGMGGFNTIGINFRMNMGMNIPGSLFDFIRKLDNTQYEINNLGAKAQAWGEFALGHSHNVTEDVRIGAKVKLLVGGAYFNVKTTNMTLDLTGPEKWTVETDAIMEAGVKGLTVGKDEEGKVDFGEFDIDTPGIGGWGGAVDLGVEYDCKQWAPGLKLSAAVIDLGFINWNNMVIAKNESEPFEFKFDEINFKTEQDDDYSKDNDLGSQFSDMGDDLSGLLNLREETGKNSAAKMLGATVNVGVEYALPMYDKLKFGLLSTTRIAGEYTWNEERLNVTLSPMKSFEIALSGALGTLGTKVGAAINLHPKGFNIFLASDLSIPKFSTQYVPVSKPNLDFTFGISHPIGRSNVGSKKK